MSKFLHSRCFRSLVGVLVLFLIGATAAIAATFAGAYSGTYSGGDSGSWTATISSTGAISLSGFSDSSGAMSGSGQASPTGSLTMTAGLVSTGSTFSGTINPVTGTVSGTWTNNYYGISGSFTGSMNTNTGSYGGTYLGSFSGDDSGTWMATVSSTGAITLAVYSNMDDTVSAGSGQLASNGSMSGSVSNGASFSGTVSPISGAFSGTWTNSSYNMRGSFLAFRPFNVVVAGAITGTSASLSTTLKVNASAVNKSGAVFVTAMVPQGTLVAAQSSSSARSTSRATTATPAFVLVQLTSSGWQPVVSGQLIPYAQGVLGDQLAAQTILNGADTTNLAGAKFCLGYGISADPTIAAGAMIAAGTIQGVFAIPDPNATGPATISCTVEGAPVSYSLQLSPGWNLLGNSLNQSLPVASLYGNPNTVTTVWKWDAARAGWQFYAPSMDAATLQNYAAGKGYRVLSEIKAGEGYWVNAKVQTAPSTQSGASLNLTAASVVSGWNLSATGNNAAPSVLNANLKARLPETGATTMWAWDNPSSLWYFYAPSLEEQGAAVLSNYIAGKGYLDFSSSGKTLGNGTGFWVNMP